MKAVLVFCEGRHDVAFVHRSLRALGGYDDVKEPIGKLPSPFGADKTTPRGLVATRFDHQDIEEFRLDNEYPPTPKYDSFVGKDSSDTMFVLLRAGGKDAAKQVIDLLGDLDVAFDVAQYDVTEYAVAFLYDADAEGLTSTLEKFRQNYGAHLGDLSRAEHAKWIATAMVPVGVFVFHNVATRTGTLEDHLAPMVESWTPDKYAGAKAFVEDNTRQGDAASHDQARRLKAIFTVTGQFGHPGASLSVILRKGLPDDKFSTSQASQALVAFLEGVPWKSRKSGVSSSASEV